MGEGRPYPGKLRAWLENNVWPGYGLGLWTEPWAVFMREFAAAIQPYAHCGPSLADRTPAKITITVSAELNHGLRQYAALYRATYGKAESVAELIPFMLGAFLESDRGFAKARRGGVPDTTTPPADLSPRPQRRDASAAPSVISSEN